MTGKMNLKIALITFAGLPNPPVKGGAVETLFDDLCKTNEAERRLKISVFSIYDCDAATEAKAYKHTDFTFYRHYKNKKISKKNIIWKLFKKSIPDKTISRVVKLINDDVYDYVIITSINYEMESVFRQIKSKVIWYLHGDPLSVLPSSAIKRITKHCHAVITVSDFVNKRVRCVEPNCPVITVRNCTDLTPVSPETEPVVRQKIRERSCVETDDLLFAYIGRITPIKGVFELVQAFVTVSIPNAKLLIVGEPTNDDEKIYFEKIKSIATAEVKYLGYVAHEALNEVYCAADCIVVPSICQEAAPLVALESSICDRLLIATNIGGIPEYATKNTFLVDYDNNFVDNLANAMNKVRTHLYHKEKNVRQINGVQQYYDDFYKVLSALDEG